MTAAEQWLQLAPLERERTAIYASGRKLRSEVNAAVQAGLKANGEIGAPSLALDVLARINTTREELRHVSTYRAGQTLEVAAIHAFAAATMPKFMRPAHVRIVADLPRLAHLQPGDEVRFRAVDADEAAAARAALARRLSDWLASARPAQAGGDPDTAVLLAANLAGAAVRGDDPHLWPD